MGKRLITRFADVNQRIIKRFRKDRIHGKQIKLKRKHTNDSEEAPLQKVCKIGNSDEENWYLKQQDEISKENVYVERLQKSQNIVLKIREHVPYDLFFNDELKNNYSNFTCKDIYFHIIDEIALEGLDGITIEAFWKRFLRALEGPLYVDEQIQNFIWQNVILTQNHLNFFELPGTRNELEIYNPFDYMHTDIGVVMEVAYELPDIYPLAPVNDHSVLGSCFGFNDRTNVSHTIKDNLTLAQIEEKYGRKLVIVADQDLRKAALCGESVDPCIEFVNMEYCILERVGRSRKLGELTHGNMSISSAFKMDSKSVFHYKKHLYQNNLISKQFFFIKSAIFDQNKTGSLLQLRRFYTNIRSHQSCMADQIINLLKTQPGCRLDSARLRKIFADNIPYINKLLKNPEFRKFVKPKVYAYRSIFPDASLIQYQNKNNKTEKSVICYELVNPYVNVAAYWRASEREDSDGEDDKEEELSGRKMYKVDTLRDIYYHIYSKGDEGCSGQEIRRKIGIDKNTTRIALSKLLGKGVIDFSKYDEGKQRKYIYKPRCWKKPNDQPSTSANSSATTGIKISSIKNRMIERQKAALAKKKQEYFKNSAEESMQATKQYESEPNEESRQIENTNNFLKIEKPQFSDCKYLVAKDITQTQPEIHLPLLEIYFSKTYNINLTYMLLDTEIIFNINQILREITPCLSTPHVKSNFEHFYIKRYEQDAETRLLLFNAVLGDVVKKAFDIDPDIGTDERISVPDLTSRPVNTGNILERVKLDYMGPNPIVVFEEEDRGVRTEVLASTPPQRIRFEKEYPKHDKIFTERVYGRIQIIIDMINEMKIIEEVHKLNKVIMDKEADSGYDKKIDRKSLLRLLKRLVEDGYIRIYKLTLNNNAIMKTLVFICHPSVDHTDDVIKTNCQQIKWKYFFSVAKKTVQPHLASVQKTIQDKFASSAFSQTDVLNSISEMKQFSKSMMKDIKRKYDTNIGKTYGVKPKFTRMRIMHEFLFFLIYESSGFETPLPIEETDSLFRSYRVLLSESDLKELPKMYRNQISWKMFVPPLPVHTGWPNGWALMCDIILRLPICVLLKVHNCSYKDSDLLDILNHPIKRNYLVKDLPEKIRKTVLFKRKYLFAIYDTINRLVFCGLVQFGPQKHKEKDQVFIYLNRKATLLDTTSSDPGYNEIQRKDYPRLSFNFQSHADVESYWQNLGTISMNTRLNTREPGKLVTLIYINSKPQILESIKSRTPEEAELYDIGFTPGDGKGACGLDSALWSHLIRNWFNTKGNTGNSLYTELRQNAVKEIPMQRMSFKEMSLNSAKFYLPSVVSREKTKGSQKLKKHLTPFKKGKPINRTIAHRKGKEKKREYNDAIDRKILKKISGTRTRWTTHEEEFIYLCKVVDIFLNSGKVYRKQVVAFSVVRDVMHRMVAESKFKTSRAIQRRWNKLQKSNYQGLEEHVSNLLQIKPISDTFGLLINKFGTSDENTGKVFKLTEQQMSTAFVILVSYVVRNQKRVKDALHGNLVKNDHLSEEHLLYTERNLIELEKKERKYEDAKTPEDIRRDVLKSVIHSSLCSKDGTVNFASRLLKIYQNYTDSLLRDAVRELRESNTITCRRWKDRKAKLWDTPFSLSQYYIFFQYSTFNKTTALEAFNTFLCISRELGKNLKSTEAAVQNKRYGQLLGMNEFFSFFDRIGFHFNLPENTVKLNPEIQNHEALVNELALRYQSKLKSLLHDNNDVEMDLEEDNDAVRSKSSQELDEEKQISELVDLNKQTPSFQDVQSSPLDLTVDSGNSDTIDRLKTWITDRVLTDIERRSPSPDFMSRQMEIDDTSDDYKGHFVKCGVHEEEKQEITDSRRNINTERSLGPIPTLEEIKTGMLKVTVKNEERTIPYITELTDLLKETFNDLKSDADLVSLKAHFITEYANLDSIIMDEAEDLQDHYMVKYIDDSMKNQRIWDRVENDIMVKDFLMMPNFEELIRINGGDDEDIKLATDIIEFASSKTFHGATGQELKDNFLHREKNYPLVDILKCLMEAGILMQTGICSLIFVHYTYQYIWVVEQDGTHIKQEESTQRQKPYIKVMPWVRVNGTLNKATIRIWISNVLSYCLDYPKVKFSKLCDKFCYIKPVDLYFITQILEEVGCAELIVYETEEQHLFSEWTMPKTRYATILDNFDEIIVQPHNISITCLGSFFYETPDKT